MSRKASVRNAIHELLQQQKLGVLSTVGGDAPYASLVAFVVSDDDRRLFFVTPRATRKFANLTANARVAMLINNSINHPEDFHQAVAVTAIGKAQPVAAMKLDAIRRQYLAKHPYLEAFAHSPSCEFVEIQIERYIMVERFQNVTEYLINHDMDHAI
jgi:nitroimidazol reductase NimA-like FMN-containing flavoprotein (pyridoxamine 5'-phosphate oxidase superfamily)